VKGFAVAQRPIALWRALADDVLVVLAGALALAVSARIKVPIGPVPITAQTLAVLLIGGLLGPKRGTLSVLTYLAAGASGLPVFAYGGGMLYFCGATGGYLVGFVPAACLVGLLTAGGRGRKPVTALAALLAGDAVIFAFGLSWVALFFPEKFALLIFLPGEALKIAIAGVVLNCLRR